ncbi:MAG TPA: AAA family ATPase [Leptospiraceae bacterium]|nr:AAA family ATPase [Leptospiraceae bacterium]HNF13378.1 AAA family ATPase [Leptospiraceae bacterium]HNH07007.1 AAA family ATPase [Leptospiraceae bacterium]HNI94979.1 AAA family ATPase [Leptospiraceae bacterium]HNM05573.1 AAA family ATPase [Leptospiraceae bacterium]
MKRLPIGIQTFSEIITENYLYVDKTDRILELIKNGKYYFVSRPRRFGKSLLISTLDSIFNGRKELFQGLYIYEKLEWKKYPVIRLDLSLVSGKDPNQLETSLSFRLSQIAEQNGIVLHSEYCTDRFQELILGLSKNGKAAVLIDEYDKPIIDHLGNPAVAEQNREILRNFFGVIKGCDEYLRFVLLTGVSKFSQVSIFSGLNNIRDITLSKESSSLFGYTEEELKMYFRDRIAELAASFGVSNDEFMKKIQKWYNGYSWDGIIKVYNPFSIMMFFNEGAFRNYWFESGTPSFLVSYIKDHHMEIPKIEKTEITYETFSSFALDNIQFSSLLFQTGYLTVVKSASFEYQQYFVLDYPNEEVRNSFFTHITASFLKDRTPAEVDPVILEMRRYLQKEDLKLFFEKLQSLFASVPYTLHLPYEAYYHSLFYMVLRLLGFRTETEVLTDKGRIDGIMELNDKIYIIEIKLDRPEKAIEQIRGRKYAEKFIGSEKKSSCSESDI